MTLIIIVLGVILAIALAMHISTEELDKGFIGIGVVVLLVICVWIFGLVKNNPSGSLMDTKPQKSRLLL